MNEALEIQTPTLAEFVDQIRDALAKAEKAGMPYYTLAGEKLLQARDRYFRNDKKGFWAWVERNFKVGPRQGGRWIDLSIETNRLLGRARPIKNPFESISEFERSRGRMPAGRVSRYRDFHEPIEKILSKVDTEKLAEESKKRREEIEQIHKLAEQIVEIGYRTLATKLHPDKKHGSKHAMILLNAARDRLRGIL